MFTTQGQVSCHVITEDFCIIGIDSMFLPEQPSSAITMKIYKENYVDNVSIITCMKNAIPPPPKYVLYILWFISTIYVTVDIPSK